MYIKKKTSLSPQKAQYCYHKKIINIVINHPSRAGGLAAGGWGAKSRWAGSPPTPRPPVAEAVTSVASPADKVKAGGRVL